MVDVQHEQPIQVTVCQSAMSEHPAFGSLRLVKLPASEYERRQIVLHLLSECQQLLGISLFLPSLLGSLLLQSLFLNEELLKFRIIQPCLDGRRALSLRRLHRRQYGTSGIDPPSGAWFLDLLPELFPCAGKSLRKMCILLKCYHLFLFFLSHKNFYCHTDITDLTDFFIKNLRIREFYCNDKNFCFAMN